MYILYFRGGGAVKSKIFDLRNIVKKLRLAAAVIRNDLISVFAAQASFFVVISSIPFALLLCSSMKYVVDVSAVDRWLQDNISGEVGKAVTGLFSEAVDKSGIPLISFTAATTLWASSKGVNAVIRGVSQVYGSRCRGELFLWDIFRSLVYTLCFVSLIVGSAGLLVFGNALRKYAGDYLPLLDVVYTLLPRLSLFIFLAILTMFFALVYSTAARRGKRVAREGYSDIAKKCPKGFAHQLPGAIFSAFAWVLFSYLYSLYMKTFPQSSYIYGSLAAVALMMLWLYTCMMIMLLGAEINKYIFLKGKR